TSTSRWRPSGRGATVGTAARARAIIPRPARAPNRLRRAIPTAVRVRSTTTADPARARATGAVPGTEARVRVARGPATGPATARGPATDPARAVPATRARVRVTGRATMER